jgi:hypothetical protein
MENEEPFGFYNDDGTKINPELISKPSMCVLCQKDDDPDEEILYILNRADQEGEREFRCDAYEAKRM